MRALLDTHTFLWWNLDDPLLSPAARAFIAAGNNQVYLSAASTWEIAIKCARGRLTLPENPDRYVTERMAHYQFLPLPIQLSHALNVFDLPPHHEDLFNRLLIAQAQLEAMPLLSGDQDISTAMRWNSSGERSLCLRCSASLATLRTFPAS